ncbi:MocR-like pyridoxine biosynthesis transcription factor PdxR [Microtetraspora niveoalba]|uniref:MocR-like pyridoxine biosynthesis transcription factor PdxR n=1 Tax=Microtetraspora niveoalba TaxID=46175 RepID=UPI0008359AF8|nr:PLP-dependent aminotransferase family protein [Microtetraspora niveoalba]
MDFHVSLAGRGDLTARIYRQFVDAILDGRLRPGERLPPTRELARRLEVSRNTVALAYERLASEGFLEGRAGAGTFVTGKALPGGAAGGGTGRNAKAATGRPRRRTGAGGGVVTPRRLWRELPDPIAREAGPAPAYDFRVGTPDPRLFPLATWRRLVAGELRLSVIEAGYGDPSGNARLRTAISRYFGISRSIRAEPDDVLVTQGAQQALDLLARVLIEPGDHVAVEEPGYPPARLLFRSLGARVTGVPVDSEGLDVAAIPATARLVYVTPSHQFPLGTPMSLERRAALLAWAERRGATVIEDDYDSEFRFGGRPLEPLQSLDRAGRVVYVGSFSKTLLPMLRVGFLVAPPSLLPALRKAKRLADWHGDPVTQAALARFIDEGLLGRQVRKATREYAIRRDLILTALRRDFAGLLRPVPSAAGLHLCARLGDARTEADLDETIARAREAGVAVESLAAYCGEPPAQPGIVLGYGRIPAERVEEGLRRLAACVPPGDGPG